MQGGEDKLRLMNDEKTYPDKVYMYHTIKLGKQDVFSLNIAIHKPVIAILKGKEQTVTNWNIESYADNTTGRIYDPTEDKMLTDHIMTILRRELVFDPEQLYYETVTMP